MKTIKTISTGHKFYLAVFAALVLLASSGKKLNEEEKESEPFAYAENIKFNHLFVVIDDSTYAHLFDSIPFFRQFAYTNEGGVDTGEESWNGKYIFGNQDYLEIFRPGGAENTELGDFGIGFMPNKLGVVDSLYDHWVEMSTDSIMKKQQTMVISVDDTIPWFNATAFDDPDSLRIAPWVMEYTETVMHMSGFNDEDLKREISHAEYSQQRFATKNNIPYDSAAYERLYEKVSALDLTLNKKELSLLRKYLETFNFEENDGAFTRADFEITYTPSDIEHRILNQISFELRESVPEQVYSTGKVSLSVKDNVAEMSFH